MVGAGLAGLYLTLTAATVRIVAPFVNQFLGREQASQTELGAPERS